MTGESTESVPVLHAYVREHLFMSPREHADLVVKMAKLAQQEGYRLGKVFTEKLETAPTAFQALIGAVLDDKATAVMVPTLHHFGVLGYPTTIRDHVQGSTGARVLVLAPADPRSPTKSS